MLDFTWLILTSIGMVVVSILIVCLKKAVAPSDPACSRSGGHVPPVVTCGAVGPSISTLQTSGDFPPISVSGAHHNYTSYMPPPYSPFSLPPPYEEVASSQNKSQNAENEIATTQEETGNENIPSPSATMHNSPKDDPDGGHNDSGFQEDCPRAEY